MAKEKLRYVLSLDVGTTSVRTAIYDSEGTKNSTFSDDVVVLVPEPGASEIDPDQLWEAIRNVIKNAVEYAKEKNFKLEGIGMSLQRNTGTFWDRKSFKIYHNFITWQDVRCKRIVDSINSSYRLMMLNKSSSLLHFFAKPFTRRFLAGAVVKAKTGMAVPRFLWLREKLGIKSETEKGNIIWGCLDSWIIRKMNAGNLTEHISEITNSTGSGVYDPFTLGWSPIVLAVFGISANCLPRVVPTCGSQFGRFEEFGLPILSIAGDTNAAMFGERMISVGDCKITMGTGAFVDLNTGNEPYPSVKGAYPLVGWQLEEGGPITYLAEADDNACGAAVEWGARNGFYPSPKESEAVAREVNHTAGVHFIPALWGLSSPINDPSAKCALLGLGPDTSKHHCARAILNSVAFRSVQLVETLHSETQIDLRSLTIDGGVSKNNMICEKIATLTNKKLRRPVDIEASARGAAYFAGISCGIWEESTLPVPELKNIVEPVYKERDWSVTEFKHWQGSIRRVLKWQQLEAETVDDCLASATCPV